MVHLRFTLYASKNFTVIMKKVFKFEHRAFAVKIITSDGKKNERKN